MRARDFFMWSRELRDQIESGDLSDDGEAAVEIGSLAALNDTVAASLEGMSDEVEVDEDAEEAVDLEEVVETPFD